MKIEVKYNIDFKKALKQLDDNKLFNTLNEGLSHKVAEESAKYIKDGKVKPALAPLTIKVKESEGSSTPKTPLRMTGKLVNSLKGSNKGLRGLRYGVNHREGEYVWTENTSYKVLPRPLVPAKGLTPRKREFIVARHNGKLLLRGTKSIVDKIYKEFEKKFTNLLSKRIRKR